MVGKIPWLFQEHSNNCKGVIVNWTTWRRRLRQQWRQWRQQVTIT